MFVSSRLAWLVLDPVGWLWWCAAVAAVCAWRRQFVWTRRALLAGSGVALVFAVLPTGALLLNTLEDRIPQPTPLPQDIDGIIILGGALEPRLSAARGQPVLGDPAERLTAGAALAHRYPNARVVFSGGNGQLDPDAPPESQAAAALLASLGIAPDRIVLEGTSRNTFENALNTRTLLGAGASGNWILVTSASHMPRAVGTFRKVGFPVLPYPVDFHTAPNRTTLVRLAPSANMVQSSLALHEWLGLLAYWLTDRSTSWFPDA